MAGRQLEKVNIVPDEGTAGHRLVVCWMTGGSGRQAEMLPDVFATEDEARSRALADYGVEPVPSDPAIDRRP